MQSVRNEALRMNTKLRRTITDADKLRAIKALYIAVYNSDESLLLCANELFHTLGDILEGTPLDQLIIHAVPLKIVLDTYADLSSAK
jgi:hypothetical protein